MVADFLNMPEIVTLFRSTHERIYQAFGEWDQDFGLCNQDGLSDTWAATYSGWMTGYVTTLHGIRNVQSALPFGILLTLRDPVSCLHAPIS